MHIQKGTLLIFTQGEYSGYEVLGAGIVLHDMDLQAEMMAYLVEHPRRWGRWPRWDAADFLVVLQTRGLLTIPPSQEVALGDEETLPEWYDETDMLSEDETP